MKQEIELYFKTQINQSQKDLEEKLGELKKDIEENEKEDNEKKQKVIEKKLDEINNEESNLHTALRYFTITRL
jgi:DNA-binding transcriptional MerR regulator